jgi:lipid A 3-O-deacylase
MWSPQEPVKLWIFTANLISVFSVRLNNISYIDTRIWKMRAVLATIITIALWTPTLCNAQSAVRVLDEVRLGVLKHDVEFVNGVEAGVDFNAEILFASPFPDSWAEPFPTWLKWVANPRPHLGGLVNSAGDTSQVYAGLIWSMTLAQPAVSANDSVGLELFFGGSANNGYANSPSADRKNLGSQVLFRLGAELGYHVTPKLGVFVIFDHESNARLAHFNGGLNNVGMRVGYRF